jgi:hypothetical protein
MKIMKNVCAGQYLEISVAMLKPIFIFSLLAKPSPLEQLAYCPLVILLCDVTLN